jgi:hypothetical protein
MRFPFSAGEDMFSYVFCLENGFKYFYAKDCEVFIKLPDNWRDHLNQSLRFSAAPDMCSSVFNRSAVKRHLSGMDKRALASAAKRALRNPLSASAYTAILIAVRAASIRGQGRAELWKIAESSKSFNEEKSRRPDYESNSRQVFILFRRLAYALIFFAAERFKGDGSPVLCYHDIGEGWLHCAAKKDFVRQLAYLKDSYGFIDPLEIKNYGRHLSGLDSNECLVTFDDGYAGIMSARNDIREMGVRPILFVLSRPDRADRAEMDNDRPLLSWDEIISLRDDGWVIGCHGATHRELANCSDEEAYEEIAGAKKELEKIIGEEVEFFAYPKGRYTDRIKKIAEEAGYLAAFSMDDGLVLPGSDRFALPRTGVNASHSFLEFRSILLPFNMRVRKMVKRVLGN